MRILHVYKDYHPVLGGIESHVRQLCQLLADDPSLSPSVLATSPTAQSERWFDGRVPVVKAGRLATPFRTPISPALTRELLRAPYDILHLHVPYPFAELSYLASMRSEPAVVTYHSDVVRQNALFRLYQPFFTLFLRRVRRIIVASPPYLASSAQLAPFSAKACVIPLGIDTARFSWAPPESVARFRSNHRSL